jgi:hypothetical protein
VILGIVFLQFVVPSSSAKETDRCNPNVFAHRGILRLSDELAILFSYLLLNAGSHLGEAYLKFLFPQSQRATPPRQLQLPLSCQTEFVICDQTIEETFRDLKSLLGLTKLMNKQQVYMEKMLALLLLIFTIGLLVGEEIRDFLYGELITEEEQVPKKERIPGSPTLKKGRKWMRYSGLFVLLKQKWSLSLEQESLILKSAFDTFLALIQPNVRTYV